MSLVVPQASASMMLQHILNKTSPQDPVLKLYTNNVSPGLTDVAGTYSELAVQGYSAKTLSGGSWATVDGAPSTASYAQQTWTADGTGGAANVYGYFVTKAGTGTLLWAERFPDGPYVLTNNGDQIKITPQFTGQS